MTVTAHVPAGLAEGSDVILAATGLRVGFAVGDRRLVAVDGADITIARSEVVALVGESGSGKSTIARTLIRAYEPDDGTILFGGTDVTHAPERALRSMRSRVQMVHQDPYASLDPHMTVGQIISEPLIAQGIGTAASRRDTVRRLLTEVGLDPSAAARRPAQFSGGQRQRISIARAIATEPELLVADEPLSSLDVSIQAQIVNLLQDMQARHHLSLLLISHDLSLVSQLADRTMVIYLGRVVEEGPAAEVLASPRHPYTAALVSAVPGEASPGRAGRVTLRGEPPSALRRPTGCHFHPRCPIARARCATEVPVLAEADAGVRVACFYPGELVHAGPLVTSRPAGQRPDGLADAPRPAPSRAAPGQEPEASLEDAGETLVKRPHIARRIAWQAGIRLAQLVVTLFVLSTTLFFLLRLTGDPAQVIAGQDASTQLLAAIRAQYGLDNGLIAQYGHFISMTATLDFGTSYSSGISALSLVMQRVWPTAELVFLSFALDVVVSAIGGCILGATQRLRWSRGLAVAVFVAQGIPFYVVALVLIQLLSDTVHLLPTIGDASVSAWILPSVTMAWFLAPRLTRVIAVNVASALDQDYVRVARASGASRVEVVLRHALPNGLMAATALAGTQLAYLVSGTLIVEEIFGWPGLGRLLIDSITRVDFPVVQAGVFVVAVFVFIVNAVTDAALLLLDPRTRAQGDRR